MPLLNRKPYAFGAALPSLDPSAEVWVVKATNEVCHTYEEYTRKLKLYGERVWSCRYSGKGNLTLEEAQAAEHKALTALKSFPNELEEQVCRAVHHSLQRVDELVNAVYDSLRPAGAEGGAVAAAGAGEAATVQQDSPSPFGSKENEPQQGGTAVGTAAEKPVAATGAPPADAPTGEPAAAAGSAAEPATVQKPEGGPAAEAKSGKKPKTPKGPVSKLVLRTYIVENAEQQGPQRASKLAWVVRPELRQQFRLPEELPADIQETLAASVEAPKPEGAPKGLGTKLPAKKEGKKKAPAPDAGSPGGSGDAAKPPKPQKTPRERGPMVRVEAKKLEEVEQQYKEGTLKHTLVAVLKAVQPEALTTQGIIDKAKELGLREFEDKHKQAINQALASDPNFLRVSKGAYSLHCLHPDKEQLVRAPQPKKRKLEEEFGSEVPDSKRREGSSGAGVGEEVDSITRAEQQVRQTKRALALHRAALEKAQSEFDAAKAAHDEDKKRAKTATPTKERTSDIHIPAEKMAEFELSEEERQYKGEADDRKALLAHRQRLQARAKELEKAKKAFLDGERQKRERAAKEESKGLRAIEVAYRKAERALEHERRSTESAEKAAAAAEKKLEKEREKAARGEERAKEKEEREKQRAVEREERERQRAEAARAKEQARRYPMEDLELLAELRCQAAEAGEPAPTEDVAPPAWLSAEESQRLPTALYVADLVSQFAKQLGCRALNYEHLEQALADATSGGAGDDEFGADALHAVYESLIELILEGVLEEEAATAQEKRWASLLSSGTWPEVLRRLVLTRSADEQVDLRPDRAAVIAASMLAFDPVDRLTHDQHLALLRFLCDAALDSEKMRSVLQRREDEAVDAKRDVREELAEQRKQLKELLDAEKEERKRKREERRAEEEKAAAEAAAAAGPAGDGDAPTAEQQQTQQRQPQRAEEPSFELPERLREFTGASGDKKALVQWRHEQQAEKRRLDKERNKWMAEQLRRQRELEATEKAAREAEKAKQREKEEMEVAIMRAQEELEQKLEKYSTRRLPLGSDRHHRRYWWGLAGHRGAVYVEDAEGRWGSISTLAELDALVASLDRRGVRELSLGEAIEKRFQAIALAMQRAERAAAAGAERKAERERAEPTRRSGRQPQQVEFFAPGKGGTGAKPAAAAGSAPAAPADSLATLFGRAECVAVEAAVEQMLELQKEAGPAVAAPKGSSWKQWAAAVKAAAEGELEGAKEGPSAAGVRALLQAKLVQLEAALLAESVGGLAGDDAESEEEADEGAGEHQASGEGSPAGGARSCSPSVEVLDVVDELFSPTKRPGVAYLWKTQRERSAWQSDLRQASTVARVAYCAAVLAQQAAPMLATLRKKGGGKGKAAKAPAAADKRGKAPAAASSRPVSRTNSVAAALDAAPSKKDKGGKRKAAAPPPENARITRSRH